MLKLMLNIEEPDAQDRSWHRDEQKNQQNRAPTHRGSAENQECRYRNVCSDRAHPIFSAAFEKPYRQTMMKQKNETRANAKQDQRVAVKSVGKTT